MARTAMNFALRDLRGKVADVAEEMHFATASVLAALVQRLGQGNEEVLLDLFLMMG